MKGDYISVRYFDNLIGMIHGYAPEACNMNGRCQCQCVIEADGGVYPCDFYAIDNWNLGNIKDKNIQDILSCETAKAFVEISLPIASECKKCKWNFICRGGCRRERDSFEEDDIALNYYCSTYREFFNYAYTRLINVTRIVDRR